jgi:hypothetical protein
MSFSAIDRNHTGGNPQVNNPPASTITQKQPTHLADSIFTPPSNPPGTTRTYTIQSPATMVTSSVLLATVAVALFILGIAILTPALLVLSLIFLTGCLFSMRSICCK